MPLSTYVQILLYMAIGLLARKRHMVDEGFCRSLGTFLVNFCLPCMIVRSLQSSVEVRLLWQCIPVLLLSLATLAVGGVVGQICYYRLGRGSRGRLFRFGLLVSNFTFMGLPLAELLLGSTGVFYFSVYTVPIRVFYYSTVETLLSPKPERGNGRTGWKRALCSPPVLGVAAGILLALTGLRLPDAAGAVISGLGGICSPLGMVLCGMSAGETDLRRWLRPRCFLLPVLRVLAMPALTFVLVYALPVEPLLKRAAVLCAALPCAGMMTTYTVRYDPDPEAWAESAAYVLLSTLLSVITLPLWGQSFSLLR